MIDVSCQIGTLFVNIHIPEAQSLKQKRMVLRSLKDKAKSKFNVSVAELDGQDKWQVASLGFTIIGTDSRYIESCLQKILSFVDSHYALEVCDHQIEIF